MVASCLELCLFSLEAHEDSRLPYIKLLRKFSVQWCFHIIKKRVTVYSVHCVQFIQLCYYVSQAIKSGPISYTDCSHIALIASGDIMASAPATNGDNSSLTMPTAADDKSLLVPGGSFDLLHLPNNLSLLHHILYQCYSSNDTSDSDYDYNYDYDYYDFNKLYDYITSMDVYNTSWYNSGGSEKNPDFFGVTFSEIGHLNTTMSLESVAARVNKDDLLPDPLPWNIKITFIVLYALIIALAIAGNFLVIGVIARTPAMRTVTNTFLVSLAVSDLCIASINMPFQLMFYVENEWTLGEGLCKFSKYMQGVVIVASIFTLTGIAIDR